MNAANKIQSNLAKVSIFMSAYDVHMEGLSEDHWGSESNILLQNTAVNLASMVLCLDVTEDDEWESYCIKATSIEINMFSINKMLDYLKISKGQKLFSFVKSIDKIDLIHEFAVTNQDKFEILTEEEIAKEIPESEMIKVQEIKVGQGLIDLDTLNGSLIRIN